MRSQWVPLLVLVLFAVRMVACSADDGGPLRAPADGAVSNDTGTSADSAPAGDAAHVEGGAFDASCAGSTITYHSKDSAGAPVEHTHTCGGGSGCVYKLSMDVGPGRMFELMGCPNQVPGEMPFWTCQIDADCGSVAYCESANNTFVALVGAGQCWDGACEWKQRTQSECPAGNICARGMCAVNTSVAGTGGAAGGNSGTTSGGFPWGMAGSGTTSGGFPWGMAGNSGSDASQGE